MIGSLTSANPGFTGQTVVYNGATLTLSNAGALGAALDYDNTGTYVESGSTLALNDLGGTDLNEGITLFNAARLINNTGNNTLTAQLLVEHDILNLGLPGTTAHIGVVDGQLNLLGGIEDHNTPGDMSVGLNTEAGENGILVVAGPIGSSIQDVIIGETASTGAVILAAANSFGGNTTILGGTVVATNNGAFSTGLVTVGGPVTLSAAGTQLANNFTVNGGSILTTVGLFEINGDISGFGGVTVANDILVLNGENTYSGETVVNGGGILLVGNSLSSTQITVDAAGLLGTTQSNVLNDAAQLTVNGQASLGGNEEIRSISGMGLIDTNIYNLGIKEGSFDGDIIGLGDLNKTTNGILTLNNPVGLLGAVNVQDGTLNLGGLGGLATTEINVSNGAFFNTGGADQLNDLAVLLANGTVSLSGNETIRTLNGNGTIDINTFALTVSDGVFNGSINNAHGDLNKVGAGTLFLGGANGYVGGTHVQMGTLELSGTLASSFVEIDALATLDLVGNQRIIDTSALTINGTLNLGGNETVATVTATGTIGGAGVLTAGTYALDGATVDANLGTGALSTAGSTTLNGNSNANTTTVTGGTTTLNGNLTNVTGDVAVNSGGTLDANGTIAGDSVTVDAGGTLNTGSAQRLANDTALTANGAVNLGGAETVGTLGGAGTVNNNGNLFTVSGGTFGGVISGAGGLDKSGFGTLTLDGVQTFTGPTNVQAGTLALGATGGLGSTTINISAGAILGTGGNEQLSDLATVVANGSLNLGGNETIQTLNGNGVVDLATFGLTVSNGTFNGAIINAHGDLNKVGPGTLILGGANTYLGETHVEGGVLTLSATGSLTATSDIDINSGATVNLAGSHQVSDAANVNLNFNAAGNAIFNVAGAETVGSLTDVNGGGFVNGGGTLTATTYALNNTTVNANLGTGALTSTGASILNGDANADTATVTGGTLTLNGDLTNATGDVTVNNTATLNANGTITADDITVDAGGTLNTGSAERLANDTTLTANGAVNLGGAETIGTLDGAGTVNNNGHLFTVNDGAFGGVISGAGGLDKSGVGTLTLNGANTYTGPTQVLNGTLDLTTGSIASNEVTVAPLGTLDIVNGSLLTSADVTVDGILNVGNNTTIANLFGGATGQVNLGANTLTLGGVDFGGVITGTGGIDVQGGDLTLGGNNTFTGTTLISTGVTTLNGTIDSSVVTISPGAELKLGSSHRIIDTATVNVNGILNMNGNETVTLVTVSGVVNGNGELSAANYTLTNGAQIDADLGMGALTSTGTTTINGNGNMDTTTVTGGTLTLNGNLTKNTGDVTVNNTATLNANGTIAADDVTVAFGGTLNTGSDERLADDVNLTVGGTVNLGGEETIGTLDGAATGVVNNNGNDLTVDDGTYSGNITGAGSLNKTSNGTLVLNNPVSYSGATNVMEGVLTLGASGGLTNSLSLNVDNGATLNTGGHEQLNDLAVLLANGTVNLGGNETILTLNGSGVVDLATFGLTVSNGDFSGTIQNAHGDLNKVTGGTLILSGANTYSGTTHLEAGILELSGTLVNTDVVDVDNTATLNLLAGERINDAAIMNVETGGTVNLNGIETIADFNLGGLLRGLGRINAATYDLTNGAVTEAGADMGDGILTSNGTTLLGGNSGANTVTVQTGTMTVNGSITNPLGLTVNVDPFATMVLGFDERIGNNAVFNLNGTLTLNGTETVTTLNMDGQNLLPGAILNGTGTLVAETYNLMNNATTQVGANLGAGVLNTGPGTVTLNGDAAAEDVNVLSGILNLNGELTDALTVDVSVGATMNLGGSERINDAAVLTVNGNLNLNGVETVSTFNLNGPNPNGILGGAGTLIADTYNLTNATTLAGANMGMGTLNLDGVNLIGGNSDADIVNVNATQTTLTGMFTKAGVVINIADPTDVAEATLVLVGNERINNTAIINNDGTLTLGGNEEIATYNSTGLLNGAGILTASGNTYNLMDGAVNNIGAHLGLGDLTSNGAVLINGTANDVTMGNNSTMNVDTADIQSGVMTLNGLFINDDVIIDIRNGARLVSGSANRVNGDSSMVNIETGGTWTLGGNETIGVFNSGGLLNGGGLLNSAFNQYNLTDGAVTAVGANLDTGTLSSSGWVVLNGNANTSVVNVDSGTLNLNGQILVASTVNVDPLATLTLGSAERIHDGSTLNNNGEVNLNGTETVLTYNSTGGHLDGSGLLTATTYNLSLGASSDFGANIGNTGNFNSNGGTVTLNGNLNVDTIDINSGNLVTNGSVGNVNPNAVITVDGGATWNVNGSYAYDTVRGTGTITPGSGAPNYGTFRNDWNISPGYSIGTLTINGDYEEDGTYHAELAPSPSSDTIRVYGYAALDNNSVLRLTAINGLDSGNVLCGERWNIIDSYGVIADYNGNFDRTGWNEITDVDNAGPNGVTFSSQVLFDRGSGDVVALGLGAGETIADYVGIDSHHLEILGAVLDGATDGIGNYNSQDGGAGTVLDAIYTAGSPGDKDSLLGALDALSPEGYAGTVDYALHATRSYAQNVMAATPQMAGRDWELVAGWSHFGLQADSSHHSHDYDLNSNGGYLGLRVNCHPDLVFGGFIAADNGSIDSGRLDLDADGFILGGFVEWTPQGEEGPWNVWGNLAYGSYEFDGHRRGLINRLSVPAFDADAFQLGVGVDYEVYEQNGLRVVPGIGLRYITASTDGFTESGGADALHVGGLDEDQLLLDLALRLYYQEVGQPYAFHGEIGWQNDFSDASRDVSATLANGGGIPFSVEAPGLGEDAFTFGLGAIYDLGERYRIGLSYRGEVRSDSDMFNGLDLRVTTGF